MYEQYVKVNQRLVTNRIKMAVIDRELEILIAPNNLGYTSPSFDSVRIQSSKYMLSDLESLNKIARLQGEKIELQKIINCDKNILDDIDKILTNYISNIGNNEYTLEYIILRDCYIKTNRKTLRQVSDETHYSYMWVKEKNREVRRKIAQAENDLSPLDAYEKLKVAADSQDVN